MSKNDNSHCAGTTKVEVMSHGKERLKRKAFKNRGCRRDVLRQTVPGAGSGNREGPIADGGSAKALAGIGHHILGLGTPLSFTSMCANATHSLQSIFVN